MVEISDVFAAYGRAVYYAQLIEYDLVSIWILDSITQSVSVTREDLHEFQAKWSRKTLGKLLHPLKESPLLPDDLKRFLEVVRKTRNSLAHDFFLFAVADFRTADGRDNAVEELERMGGILMKGHGFFRGVLTTYTKDFNIDCNAVWRQLLAEDDENAEQPAAVDG